MVSYRLIRENGDPQSDFKRIIDYLLTFVGDITIERLNEKSVVIGYSETPMVAGLKIDNNGEIILACEDRDEVSVNLIKNVTGRIGRRIFSTRTKSFLVNDPNLLEATPTHADQKVLSIIKKHGLTPLFLYRNSFTFFAKDKIGKIFLINQDLLRHLSEQPEKKVSKNDFSIPVAVDIGHFVAIYDRGLIPLSFYKCRENATNIFNLNGLSTNPFKESVIIEPIYFHLDLPNQNFIQGNSPPGVEIKKGQSLQKILKLKDYLVVKIGREVHFEKKRGKLLPKLTISIFLDN
ncbi:hypothetical protein HZA76_00270 [Candidatus Roizmanbacteria bacterium]|nr:hypothetical protein [Candidatus Roizmanbacteria bacterium]